jgi:uncharacterized protein
VKTFRNITLILCLFLIGAAFPKPAGYVTDQAGLISYNTKNTIHSLAYELEQKSGAQLAVVTVKTLNGLAIDDYSWQLFEKWGIGEKGKDTGVLLLIAPNERKLRIEVGYGFEGAIPDGLAGEIIRSDMLPYFKTGKMDQGILRGALVLLQHMAKEMNVSLSGSYRIPQKIEQRKTPLLANILYFIFLLFIFSGRLFFFPLLLGGHRRGYYSRGGGGFGGFGGFGGGLSGGGGASGSW